jgi:hypothetical protein
MAMRRSRSGSFLMPGGRAVQRAIGLSVTALVLSAGGAPGQHALSEIKVTKPVMSSATQRVRIANTNYLGWKNAIVISNQKVEAIIVPAVGRIMQFRFVGEDGVFWENREISGLKPDPKSSQWGNFGGDKSWPSPQSDWPRVAPRAWPPPVAFDSMPVSADVQGHSVVLTSEVDPNYGIRIQRIVDLDSERPEMRIGTTFEKVRGAPVTAGIWIVTQLKEPVAVYVPGVPGAARGAGYVKLMEHVPPSLKNEGGMLQMQRDPRNAYKIGSEAGSLLWVGEKNMLRIDSPRVPGEEYPDQGSSVEVYTNPNPLIYVELETLGPLKTLKKGDKITRVNTYTLLHRGPRGGVEADAKNALGGGN